MSLLLKKFVSAAVLPPGIFIIILLTAGAFLIKNSRRWAYFLLGSGFALYLISTEAVSRAIMSPLEQTLTSDVILDGDVIIVLGGGITDNYSLHGDVMAGMPSDSTERTLCSFFLWKDKNIPIIYSGGTQYAGGVPEASAGKRLLVSIGVPPEMVIEEGRSLDTRENAAYSKQIMEKMNFKKAVLVTSAWHATRADVLFKNAGIPHSMYRCGAARGNHKSSSLSLLPSVGSLGQSTAAIKEYLGTAFYSATSR
ncbi:MAG: YdcF family protein [Nitrospinae bacterium]|nr:YdcF family protein [Nitrospinota bacterium]